MKSIVDVQLGEDSTVEIMLFPAVELEGVHAIQPFPLIASIITNSHDHIKDAAHIQVTVDEDLGDTSIQTVVQCLLRIRATIQTINPSCNTKYSYSNVVREKLVESRIIDWF